MKNHSFTTFVYADSRLGQAELPIAATRAGGVGVINAELETNPDNIFRCLDRMEHPLSGARGPYGLKIGANAAAVMGQLTPCLKGNLRWLILDASVLDELAVGGKFKKPEGVKILAECITGDMSASASLVDGFIIKGNESGGYVGEESSFILLQKWVKLTDLPLYLRGGLTPHVAAACHAMGIAGGVLDSQVLLLNDSPLAGGDLRRLLATLSGSETIAVGDNEQGFYFRVLSHPQLKAAREFIAQGEGQGPDALRRLVSSKLIDWCEPKAGLLPVGHDICFAEAWRRQYGTVAAVIRAIDEAVTTYASISAANPPLRAGSPLAQSLGTGLPIIQGPMTRVSDVPQFAQAIADGGALPMLAFALLTGTQVSGLLEKARPLLAGRKWGVGLLGFVPPELLAEQIGAALPYRPDYAIIAGGRPDQAVALEAQGIPSFLHLPSATLLGDFLKGGARRFIFEGRECGGHIGPLSSFVLWSSMIDRLLTGLDENNVAGEDVQCIFAGGIHDAWSSALLQVMVAPLIKRNVKIGIIMGSAYLFTKEIVDSGAVVKQFQDVVVECDRTVVLETGPGHASRCALTPFAKTFYDARREYRAHGEMPADTMREKLDRMILGTLRLASKGLIRKGENDALTEVSTAEQKQDGMYMLGQVVLLREDIITIGELHQQVTEDAQALLEKAAARMTLEKAPAASRPADIAIIGMSCALPGAADVQTYWENILDKINAVTEIPRHRWDSRLYFDADRHAPDKIYSKWGGFLADMPFDPMKYGITPKSIESVDPMQLMALEVAQAALKDANYSYGRRERERTSVIIGASGGIGDVGAQYGVRAELPRFAGALSDGIADRLPEWTEDTFAGILINVVAGRIANRFDLGGANFTTDAACASSMAAIYQAVLDLAAGNSDTVIAGGVDTVQGPFGYMCFSKTQALSPRGVCNTFDQDSDGIVISEGIVMLVLKRLEDAERDGDRIYAVIKGAGVGSDGKAKGLSAPLPEGQLRAMRRAYDQAGFSPATVRLFEAHGTGTVAGDTAELESTGSLLRERGAAPRQSVVGSVKTMIGHTKACAGVAGLVKATLALHNRVLPPHRGVKTPNRVLAEKNTPLYLIDEAEPWLTAGAGPRRAAVSAFGFGGTNFHVVLEEYRGEYRAWNRQAPRSRWPAELFLWSGRDRAELRQALARTAAMLTAKPDVEPRDLAFALAESWNGEAQTVAIVAQGLDALANDIASVMRHLEGGEALPPGACYSGAQTGGGKVAVLFSGQGSQYAGMLRELAVQFPVCADALTAADGLLSESFEKRFGNHISLSHFIYPRGAYSQQEKDDAEKALRSTDVAQPALGAVEAGLWSLITGMGLKADMLGGHSYGEFVALHAAGRIRFADLMAISEARGRLIVDKAKEVGTELGGMAAVKASRAEVEAAIAGMGDIVIANHNAPQQVIISGSEQALAKAAEKLKLTRLPVAAAFHSPFVEPARAALAEVIGAIEWKEGHGTPVYSNGTAQPHVADTAVLRKAMEDHLVSPVNFVAEIEAMYDAGARVFLELGPKTVLADLTRRILGDRPHTAIAVDGNGGGLAGLMHAAAQLLCAGVRLDVLKLFEGRDCLNFNPDDIASARRHAPLPKHAWLLNGSCARRAGEPVRQIGVTADEPVSKAEAPAVIGKSSATPDHTKTQRRVMPVMTREPLPEKSAAEAYFELLDRQLNNARDVALAQMGLAPSAGDAALRQPPRTAVPPRQVAALPAAIVARPPVPLPAPKANGHINGNGSANGHHAGGNGSANGHHAGGNGSANGHHSGGNGAANGSHINGNGATNGHAATNGHSAPVKTQPGTVAALDLENLKQIILSIVTEKTGYEADMIEFGQNMEADLGIDSIKRVEIVGSVLSALPDSYVKGLGEAGRTQLSTAATFDKMLKLLADAGGKPVNFNMAGTEPTVTEKTIRHPSRPTEIRFEVVATEESAPASVSRKLTKGNFLLVADRHGVGMTVATLLKNKGCPVHIVPSSALTDEKALMHWCEKTSLPALAGVVHLASLEAVFLKGDETSDTWRKQIFSNEKSLFLLLRHFKLAEGAHVLSASALGGTFGRENISGGGLSLQGGAIGLVKSYSHERKDVRARSLDLDPALDISAMAAQILDELEIEGGRVEVGYPAGKRTIFKTKPVALPETLPETDIGLVVLATGGARGVTAETLRELAKLGNTLVLTGRSPMPAAESPETRDLSEEKDIVRHFAKSQSLPLNEARKKAKAVLAVREQLNNIEDFKKSGAVVDYRAVDVADESAMAAVIADIYQRYGRIDGVVHGAGVIEDKLLADIVPESWSRVVETKVIGLLLLQKYLRPETLKFLTVFSSVAGRFGNAGQTNYATANELMNRICAQLRRQWGEKVNVSALCWGPWGKTKFGVGMVTEATEEKFLSNGVSLVPAGQGRALFRNQIAKGDGAVEVVCGAAEWEKRETAHGAFKTVAQGQPLLDNADVGNYLPGQSASVDFTIGKGHLYLQDHVIDGQLVLPMAVAMEMMAQATEKVFGEGWIVAEIRNGQLFKGVIIDRDDYPLTVVLAADQIHDVEKMIIRAKITGRGGKSVPHYGAQIVLAKTLPLVGPVVRVEGSSEHPVTLQEAYDSWLFTGPRFQVIGSLDIVTRRGVGADVRSTAVEDLMDASGRWLFDPGLVDAAGQAGHLLTSVFENVFTLPVNIVRIARHVVARPQPLRMECAVREQDGAGIRIDAWFIDGDGKVVLTVEGMQQVASKAHKVGVTKNARVA